MSKSVLVALSLCLVLNLAIGERIKFDNYRVYKVTPQNKDDLKLLADLDGSSDSLRFLEAPEAVGKDIHIVVAPHKNPDFLQILNQQGIRYELVEKNLQKHLDADLKVTPRASSEYNWKQYHTLDSTYNWLDSLVQKYPQIVEGIIGGSTYEGRQIRGVKVSFKEGNKGIFLEGGIHAREWISPATVTYILNELLTSKDPQVREIAESYDWYIFPHTNPDGYVYTHTTDRLWRKTRSPNTSCYGTDPNRNWDFHWMEIGASSNPCSETYAGKKAFSEIETRSLAKYIESLKGKIHTYLSFHSFSQLLLFPYGHTRQHAVNHDDLQQIGDVTAKALARRYGTSYVVGNVYEAIYPAAGASIDWVYGKVDVPISYTYELRPKSSWNGFVLPPEQIIPTGEETLDSLVALVKETKSLGYLLEYQKNSTIKIGDSVEEIAEELLVLGIFINLEVDPQLLGTVEKVHQLLMAMYNGVYEVRNIITLLTPHCDDMLVRCKFMGEEKKCSELFDHRLISGGICCTFNYQRPTFSETIKLFLQGKSFPDEEPLYVSYGGPENSLTVVLKNNLSDFAFQTESTASFKVLIFRPMDFPDTLSGSLYINYAEINTNTHFAIHPEILDSHNAMRYYTPDVRKCYYHDEGNLPIKGYYSIGECYINCQIKEVMNSCGCILPFHPNMQNKSFCMINDLPCVVRWHEKWLDQESFTLDDFRNRGVCNHCLTSCEYIKYRAQKSWSTLMFPKDRKPFKRGCLKNLPVDDYAVIHLFFASNYVRKLEQSVNRRWTDMLGQFGGICSLMFGATIISLIELIYYLTGKFFTVWYDFACIVVKRKRYNKISGKEKTYTIYWNELCSNVHKLKK